MQTEDLGALLKGQRQEKNFTIEQVSKALSIRPFIIEALESGQYDSIDAPLYTRNYLKQYAEFLGFSHDEVAVMVKVIPNNEISYQHLKRSTEIKNIENRRKKRFIMKLYFFAVLLLIVGVYLYFTVDRHGDFFESKLPAKNNSSRLQSALLNEDSTDNREETQEALALEAPSLFGEESIEEVGVIEEGETTDAPDNTSEQEELENERDESLENGEDDNLTQAQEISDENEEILGSSLTEEVARVQSIARQSRSAISTNSLTENILPNNEEESIHEGDSSQDPSSEKSEVRSRVEGEKNILYIAVESGENWVGILRNNSAVKQGVVSPNNPLRLEVEDSFLSGEEGESFLQIRFGNAPSVSELRFNGQSIASELYTPESGKSVITFKLDVAEYQ